MANPKIIYRISEPVENIFGEMVDLYEEGSPFLDIEFFRLDADGDVVLKQEDMIRLRERMEDCELVDGVGSFYCSLYDWKGVRILLTVDCIRIGNEDFGNTKWVIEVRVISNYLEAIWDEYVEYRLHHG